MLTVDGVSLSVGGRRILEDVSFEVRAGEVVSLVGPNGAGKSTILGVIAGDIKPDSGSVLLKDKPVGEYSYLELARLRALLLQKTQVAFSYLVHEVVAMGRTPWRGTKRAHEDDAVIEQMMARTHTEMMANRDVTTLSGGESGRVHLARIFVQQTPLVLLDEPTAALDIKHQEQTLQMSRELAAEGTAVLAVLHDLDVAAAYSDRIVLLDRGRVAANGTPAQVCTEERLSRVYQHPIEVLEHPVTKRILVLPRR